MQLSKGMELSQNLWQIQDFSNGCMLDFQIWKRFRYAPSFNKKKFAHKKLHTYGSWEFFFLCSTYCPKQPRTSFPFYKFFYPTTCCKICDFIALVRFICITQKFSVQLVKLLDESNYFIRCFYRNQVHYLELKCQNVSGSLISVEILKNRFCFSRHPWDPWGHQSSGMKPKSADSVTVQQ